MNTKLIKTSIGGISIHIKEVKETIPVIFLHGVYFDHTLWKYQTERITDRTVIAVDMPFHGESKNISNKHWTLDDCATMLIELLDSLKIEKTIAIGHSWGSMTILRAANKAPERFQSLGLCNMPFQEPKKAEKRNIRLQHTALIFKNLYMKQAAKALMSKESLKKNPALLDKLIVPMSTLKNREIKYTDKAVRINSKDAEYLIKNLTIPFMALVGEEDYVGVPPIAGTFIVKGGHVSPVEVPQEVFTFIQKVVELE